MSVRVLLVEDEAIVREGVRALLEPAGFEVVAEAPNGIEAIRLVSKLTPDVAVIDLFMPSMGGLSVVREMRKVSPGTRAIVLTSHHAEEQVLEALHVGVRGYVLKTQPTSDLLQAIREVSQGYTYLSPGISHVLIEAATGTRQWPKDPLTTRELEVLQLIAEGKTTKKVALVLGVSAKTAEFHRSQIMKKLDVHDTATLVRYAIRRHLLRP